MRWFQPIECDKTEKNPLVCDVSNLEKYDFEEDDFKNDYEILDWPKDVFFKASQKRYDGTPDDVLQNGYMLPVYSKKLKDALNDAEIKGIQYLPIRVMDYDGNQQNSFFIANFRNCVEVLDLEKSIYNRFSEDFPNPNVRGAIAGVRKFVLKKEKLEGFDVIRLKEYNQRFFVSEKFVHVFEQNKFTGYSFKEVDVI